MLAVVMTSYIASVVVLAAGQGKRMKSTLPKVLHPVCGRPMVLHVLDAAGAVGRRAHGGGPGARPRTGRPHLPAGLRGGAAGAATGHRARGPLRRPTRSCRARCWCCPATPPGHRGSAAGAGAIIISVRAPRPPCSPWTWTTPRATAASCATLTASLARIVEHRDATPEELAICEVNSAMYVLPAPWPWRYCERWGPTTTRERSISPMSSPACGRGERVAACKVADPTLVLGVNSREELALAEELMAKRRGLEAPAEKQTLPPIVIPYKWMCGGDQGQGGTGMREREPRRCARMTPERSLMVFSGRGNPELSAKVADKLGIELGQVDIKTFADGEIYVKYDGEHPRRRRVHHPAHVPAGEREPHGAAHHDPGRPPGLRPPRHRRRCPGWATPGRTRRAARASPSPPGWWPTSCRPPGWTGWSPWTCTPASCRASSACRWTT